MTTFDSLATNYEAGRTGYANDLYDVLIGYGLNKSHAVLDVGTGTGLAAEQLVANGFDVTGVDASPAMIDIARSRLPAATFTVSPAERLPFADRSFDAVISAQAFHHFDRPQAMREIVRVLKPGGMMAIWWKRLMGDDPVKLLRDETIRAHGTEPPVSGLSGGFKEFYAATLADHTLRVIPWRVTVTVSQFTSYERSRKSIRDSLGSRSEQYFRDLESRLIQQYGGAGAPVTLAYMHYLYLGKTL